MKAPTIPTVFIIDDDRGMRQAIQDLVESVGLHAESFANGQEFLNKGQPPGPCSETLGHLRTILHEDQLTPLGLEWPDACRDRHR